MRFLQIADLHIGADTGLDQNMWEILYQILKHAEQLRVGLVLVAGDIFHRQPLKKDVIELNKMFAEFSSMKFVCIAGNHDYIKKQSYYLTADWAENVTFLWKREMDEVVFPEWNLSVHGCSFWNYKEEAAVYDTSITLQHGRSHFLLAHGGDRNHRPFSTGALLHQGYDYIAFGHIHKPNQIVEGKICMAGSPIPFQSDDIGSHGYWIGTFDGKHVQLQFYPLKLKEYVVREVEVSSDMSQTLLQDRVLQILESLESYQIANVKLVGYRSWDAKPDLSGLEQHSRIGNIRDETQPDFDFRELRRHRPDSLESRFLSELMEYPDQELGLSAMYYGMEAILYAKENEK